MSSATVTSKGRLTLPKDIREGLGIKPGNLVTFTLMPNGTALLRVKNKSGVSLVGSLKQKRQKRVPGNHRETWRRENAEAIEAYNRLTTESGIYSDGCKSF